MICAAILIYIDMYHVYTTNVHMVIWSQCICWGTWHAYTQHLAMPEGSCGLAMSLNRAYGSDHLGHRLLGRDHLHLQLVRSSK